MNSISENIIRILSLVLIQVLIIKEITFGNFSYYLTPFIYPLALIIFPIGINKYWTLIIAFLTGLMVDTFMNSQGIHASASLLLMYIRPYLIQNKDEIEPNQTLSINIIGNIRFLYLITFLTVLLHFWVFLLESFTISLFFHVILRTILSSFLAIILMYIGLTLFRKNKK